MTQQRIDLSDVDAIFRDVEQAVRQVDYAKIFTSAIPVLEAGEQKAFSEQQTPSGNAWLPLRPATAARKKNNSVLFATGRLKNSLIATNGDSIRQTDSRSLTFGTAVPYSIFHQEGTARLPQREHVGMNEQTCQTIVDLVANATVEGMKG